MWSQGYLGRSMIQGLHVRDLGKLIPSGIVAATVLGLVGRAFRRDSDEGRTTTVQLVLLMGALAFFGLAVDTLDVLFSARIDYLMGIVEDGGEMIVMSFFVLVVGRIVWREGSATIGERVPPRHRAVAYESRA